MAAKDMEVRYLAKDFEVRALEDGTKTVTGYVVKFNMRSHLIYGEFYEKVAQGAFAKALEENTVKALWNHRSDFVLGSSKNQTLRLIEDEIGLRFELDLPNNTWGNDAFESIHRGDVDGVSFGFTVREDSWQYIKDEDVYERTLLNVDLKEISPTPFPAYPDSEIGKRSLEGIPDTKEVRQMQKQQELMKRKLLIELELS
ncbi:HK97 family phage prohead protease [Paenibacillus sp. NPDC093718]|uniref:HK97 family phage prohead protease n=1 Tax=Paenibacillus sp. NPDC093718 TaxID=3390601 RepID=UPI003CFD2E8C